VHWLLLAFAAQDFDAEVRPLIRRYCLDCHSTEKHKGDLDLERFTSRAEALKKPKVWLAVIDMLSLGEMPPKEKPQPSAAERERLVAGAHRLLEEAAHARAGDPGPVLLRRLSNAEYTWTLRDLTGVASLDPAREFPADSASGEGFANVGHSLVMSPALLDKVLDAAKGVARHAVLLPDGIRFSPSTTRRDWTEELLAEIRADYARYTLSGGGTAVDLQGIRFDTKDGGVLPLERYLAALRGGSADGLSPKYLALLRAALEGGPPSPVLDPIRARWREGADVAQEIARWQRALWKFNAVGHIGKAGGPKSWMEAVSPLQARQELRMKIADGGPATIVLVASDAGDGADHDEVVWERPRLAAPGRPDVLLRDVDAMVARRARLFASAQACLAAAVEPERRDAVNADDLRAWLDLVGIGDGGPVRVEGHLKDPIRRAAGYDFINGWGVPDTPNMVANSSDQHVRIPGNMKPHGVAVHPSPKLAAAVGWQSPVEGPVRVEARVQHAHPECGNGVTWSLELRRGGSRRRLASGTAQGGQEGRPAPVESLEVRKGDLVSLLVGPRDGNHACDLTAVDLTVTGPARWDLAEDVSPDVLAGNPHADRHGNADVWHFYVEPDGGAGAAFTVPPGSALARWQDAGDPALKRAAAAELQALLAAGPPQKRDSPDATLYRALASLNGPLLRGVTAAGASDRFDADGNLRARAPSVLEFSLPADLVAGCEFVAAGSLADPEGSVQLELATSKPQGAPGLRPGAVTQGPAEGPWTAGARRVSVTSPVLVADASAARRRFETAFDEFRRLFPAALCYTKIVPVDEVVTLTLYYREDEPFKRLLLDEAESKRLDRLWDELHYVSHDALALVDVFEQLWQYATQDADPKVFEPMREPIARRAAEFRRRLVDTEPAHVEAVLGFAARAWRRPLSEPEQSELRRLYRNLREQELDHDEAIRLTLARVLAAPAFLYKLETPPPGAAPGPLGDGELASRLSYFLWSSAPDAELGDAAARGTLRAPGAPAAQARRMLRDPRVRRLAVEFGCAWLQIHGFDTMDEKSERHFPTFASLRGPMYEEATRFFADFFERDASILSLLDADHAFLNEALASHYGVPGVSGADWRRVEGVRAHGRGGILGLAATLSKHSGASRTSPILRGTWISEVLLGEKLPKPPPDVPLLPEEEPAGELTVRQMVERHTADPKCAGCHRRIDPLGFSLEAFDAIGRRRERASDTRVKLIDGAEFDGPDGLRGYLLGARRDAFVKQFCRKLLGYALGREVLYSDEPLLREMRAKLEAGGYRVGIAVEAIVESRQFREIRGKDASDEE
jgi:hypothetical protein